jgi:hypothetical protein
MCHLVQKNSARWIWKLWSGRERLVAAAGSPWAEARVGQPWSGLGRWVDVARRHREGANHRSALLVAQVREAHIQPSPSRPCAALASLGSHARKCDGCQRLGLLQLRLLRAPRLLFAHASRSGCVPRVACHQLTADSTARPKHSHTASG